MSNKMPNDWYTVKGYHNYCRWYQQYIDGTICPPVSLSKIATEGPPNTWTMTSNSYTLACNTLTIPVGQTLFTASYTLINNGTIQNSGTIKNSGTITNTATGSITNIATGSIINSDGGQINGGNITNYGTIFSNADIEGVKGVELSPLMTFPPFVNLVSLYDYNTKVDPDFANVIITPTPTSDLNFELIVATELMKMVTLAHGMFIHWMMNKNSLTDWTLDVSAPRFSSNFPQRVMYSVFQVDAPPMGFIVDSAMDDFIDVWFVFRGTSNVAEWMENSNFALIKTFDTSNGAKIHSGFYNLYSQRKGHDEIPTPREVVINYVEGILTEVSRNPQRKYRLRCAGHSLGGALSVVCCYDIIRKLNNSGNPKNISVSMYSNAAPVAVGNKIFADYLNSQLNIEPYSWRGRVSNKNDFVPKIRLEFLGYKLIKEYYQIEFGEDLSSINSMNTDSKKTLLTNNHSYVGYLNQLLKNLKKSGYDRQKLLSRLISYTDGELTAAGFE